MAYNGSGTFVVNTAGQPVVPNTVISATAFNALTNDLANGLSTCITKDGQTTPTANIPMGNNKITGLAPGTSGTDAANLSQVQGSTAKLLQSVTGTDTITAAMVPALTSYSAGQMFYFVAAGDNTGAVTINIDSLGAKSVTRDGSTALVAGDIVSGEVALIVYDGTRFQLLNGNSFTNLNVSNNLTLSGGTANGVLYLNGSKVATSGSALTFDGTNLGIGTSSPQDKLSALSTQGVNTFANPVMSYGANLNWPAGFANIYDASYVDQFMLLNARMTGGTRAAPTFTASSPAAGGIALKVDGLSGGLAIQTIPNGTGVSATTRAYFDSSGNLGLGVTPSAWASGWKAIQVGSLSSLSNSGAVTYVGNNFYQNTSSNNIYLTSSHASLYGQTAGQHIWYNAPSGTAGNTISFTQAMTLDTSGNLLVGSGVSGARLSIRDGGGNDSYFGLGANYDVYISSGSSGTHYFRKGSSSVMTLDASGNLGVGTTSPVTNLHVYKTTAATSGVQISSANWGSTLTDGMFVGVDNNNSYVYTYENIPLVFGTNNTERGRFTAGGDLLVGNTASVQSSRAEFTSTSLAPAFLARVNANSDEGQWAGQFQKKTATNTTSQIFVRFLINDGATASGYITANGANAATFTSSSDARLKENIVDLPPQLSNILALKPVEFDYKDGSGHQIGFIAQELEHIYPDCVSEGADGMLQIGGWSKTEARLVKALQEQQAMIEALKAKVSALEAQ